jgi:FixJ family two-component response regulator
VSRGSAPKRCSPAIVFITAYADETVRPSVLEQGAVECLFKPFSDTALRDALDAALHVA